MPNRIIKESIHTSDGVNAMTDFQFRLWVSLITYVDDFGRGDARPAIIKGQCFPLRPKLTAKDIENGLQALANLGCIRLYEVDGKSYFYFPRWEDHQRIRSKISKFPAPETELQTLDSNLRSNDSDTPQNAPVIQSNPIRNTIQNTNTNKVRFVPPTLEEVRAYCKDRNSPVDPVKFWEYFTAGGWKDAKGQPVRSWKQKLLTWEKYDKAPNAVNTSYPTEPAKSAEEDDKAARDLLAKLKGA